MSVLSAAGVGGDDGGGSGWGRGWKKGLVVHFMVAVVVRALREPRVFVGLSFRLLFLQDARRGGCVYKCRTATKKTEWQRKDVKTQRARASKHTHKSTPGEQGADSSPSSTRSEMSPSTPSQQRRHPGPPPRLWGPGVSSNSVAVIVWLLCHGLSPPAIIKGANSAVDTALVVNKRLVTQREFAGSIDVAVELHSDRCSGLGRRHNQGSSGSNLNPNSGASQSPPAKNTMPANCRCRFNLAFIPTVIVCRPSWEASKNDERIA